MFSEVKDLYNDMLTQMKYELEQKKSRIIERVRLHRARLLAVFEKHAIG